MTASGPAHLRVPGTKRFWPNLVGGSKVAPLSLLFAISNHYHAMTIERRERICKEP